jgi:DNA-binding CsgD family transcriptional regulator
VLTEVNVRRGDLAAAKAAVAHLRPLLESREATATAAWAPALLIDSQGDPARALAELFEGLDLLARSNYRLGVPDPPQLAALTALALRAGDGGAATTAATAAESLALMNPGVPSLAGVAAHARGIVEGDPARLREAVGLLEQGQRPLAVAAAQEDLAGELGPDARAETVALLEAALEGYERAGALRDCDRVRSALRRRGVRRRVADAGPSRSGWASLTAAELAVTCAIGEGLTSRQVADQLFISVHTVNTHLRHAFLKLGIRSRVELVRMMKTDDQVGRSR